MKAACVKSSSEDLRSAHPRLIARAKSDGRKGFYIEPHLNNQHPIDDLVIEGFDPSESPLAPVYWRVVGRGDQKLYLSTVICTADQVARFWGKEALSPL